MSSSRCHWSPGWLLLLLGGSLGVHVEIHRGSISGTVGQSVLLPVSYRFDAVPREALTIRWRFSNSTNPLVSCTVWNCSLGAGGAPSSCSTHCLSLPTSHGRSELFPLNGSLLLRDLQLGDSGIYSVTFRPPHRTWPVTLAVHEQRSSREQPADTTKQHHIPYLVIGICSSVSLLLLSVLLWYIWHWGAARQKRRRITEQQQVSSVEEPHMEGTVAGDLVTIYARIGDHCEQPEPSPVPEVYTSISSLGPPAQPTVSYNLLV
ncbi:uncharacterized protein O3Q21_005811 isoform 2-T3 [Podargus strigoides]